VKKGGEGRKHKHYRCPTLNEERYSEGRKGKKKKKKGGGEKITIDPALLNTNSSKRGT